MMTHSIGIALAALTLGAVAAFYGWFDLYHVLWGSGLFLVLGAPLFLLLRSRRVDEDVGEAEEADSLQNPVRSAAFGVLGGIALSVSLLLAFALLSAVGLGPVVTDPDRATLEVAVAERRAKGDPEGAARLIEDQLERGVSAAWEPALLSLLYTSYLEAGDEKARVEVRLSWYEKAQKLARSKRGAHLDAGLADEKMKLARAKLEATQSIVQQIDTLESTGDYERLVALLELKIEEPRGMWVLPYDQELVDAYLAWGDTTREPQKRRRTLYEEALRLSEKHDVDAAPVLARLDRLEAAAEVARIAKARERDAAAAAAERARLEEKRRQEIAAAERRIAALAEEQRRNREEQAEAERRYRREKLEAGDVNALAALYREKVEGLARENWVNPYDRWLYEALIALAHATEDLERKVERYEEALDVADTFDLHGEDARKGREQTMVALRKAREAKLPRILGRGAHVGIEAARRTEGRSYVTLQAWVETDRGDPILDLEKKDFVVEMAGKAATISHFEPVVRRTVPLSVLLALDRSGSTGKHRRLKNAKKAARQFLKSLEDPHASFSLLAFNDVVRRYGWTKSPEDAAMALSGLEAGGGTALYGAIASALESLKTRRGDRRLVVFTDGEDSEGGMTVEVLAQKAQDYDVPVFVIGLGVSRKDAAPVARLCRRSGGAYFESSTPDRLLEDFNRAARHLRMSFYELHVRFDPRDVPTDKPLTISVEVGRGEHKARAAAPVTVVEDVAVRARAGR